MINEVNAILVGFGHLAQTRTIIPVLKNHKTTLNIVGVSDLKDNDYDEFVVPAFASIGLSPPIHFKSLRNAIDESTIMSKLSAIIITTPSNLHFEQALLALQNNLDVFVDKPVVTSSKDLMMLLNVADQNKVLFCTGVQRRLEGGFRYLHKVSIQKIDFAQLRQIHCRLLVGQKLSDWRVHKTLAGGGILMDSGFHLLDIAAWILKDIYGDLKFPDIIKGSIRLVKDTPHGLLKNLEVETEAYGYIELEHGILLTINFTYNQPIGVIYEEIELVDSEFTRLRLRRQKNARELSPTMVTHQKADGEFASVDISYGNQMKMDSVRFTNEAVPEEPLIRFIRRIEQDDLRPIHSIKDIEAKNSLLTLRLIEAIYAASCY